MTKNMLQYKQWHNLRHRTHDCGRTFDTTDASAEVGCSTCHFPSTSRHRG